MEARAYQQVNEVLKAVGGRWSSREGAHLFSCDASEAIAPVLASGEVVTLREKRNDAQYFPTPAPVVERLCEIAGLEAGMEVLEPSAGSGALVTAAAARGAVVDCFERDPGYAATLIESGVARTVQVVDFLAVPAAPRYDRVVMNPPFTRQADIAHVTHALEFLKPGGLLAAVMSHGVTFQRGEAPAFRHLVEERGGTVEALPAGAFAQSGTGVATILVTIPATRPAQVQPVVWRGSTAEPEQPEETFEDPAVLAAQIVADLAEATRHFEAVARSLGMPASAPARPVSAIPVKAHRTRSEGQLAFEGLEEAS